MLLKRVEITHISPCLADTAKIKLKAILSDDISEAMPYLNAVLKNATYNHHAPNLSLYKDFRLITLYPREMTMIKALNTTDAHQVIEWLRSLSTRLMPGGERLSPITSEKENRILYSCISGCRAPIAAAAASRVAWPSPCCCSAAGKNYETARLCSKVCSRNKKKC